MRKGNAVLRVFSYIGLMVGFVGIMFLVMDFKDGISAFLPPVDLYSRDTDYNDIGSFDMIDSKFDLSLGCFGTLETTRKQNGSITSRDYTYYYAIPAFSGEDTYWIGIEVPSGADRKTMEKITEETWAWLSDQTADYGATTLAKQGALRKMDDKMFRYMKEYFEEIEWFESQGELDKYVLPVYIDTFYADAVRGMFIFGVIGTAVGIASLVFLLTNNKRQSKRLQRNNMLTVGGAQYPRSAFESVNHMISQHETVFAIQEFCRITGVSSDEAGKIIKNWRNF